MTEIASIYAGDPAGIVVWTRAPGKKRAGFRQMPAFNNLPGTDLDAVAQYMLEMPAEPTATEPAVSGDAAREVSEAEGTPPAGAMSADV